MRKTDLFPENDSPGCELREPERPIDAPYAVDIPAVPTALGALDAASRAEFWAALALSHTDGLGARSRKRLLDAFGSAFEAVRRANDWREAGLREDLIREFRSENGASPPGKNGTQHGNSLEPSCSGPTAATPRCSRNCRMRRYASTAKET